LILGIIGTLAVVSILIWHFEILTVGWELIVIISGISFYFAWLFAIVGIVLGIMGLKSVVKKLAISGLVLSITSLTTYIYMVTLVMGLFNSK
jgi:hypothetical protein